MMIVMMVMILMMKMMTYPAPKHALLDIEVVVEELALLISEANDRISITNDRIRCMLGIRKM